jgi:hypothetical protein
MSTLYKDFLAISSLIMSWSLCTNPYSLRELKRIPLRCTGRTIIIAGARNSFFTGVGSDRACNFTTIVYD